MTTHAWAEQARGKWTLEIRFDNDNTTIPSNRTSGEFFEWSLVLHGTKNPPYENQTPLEHLGSQSKLFITKQIHQNHFQDKSKFIQLLKQDNQQRLGSDDEIIM